MKPFIVVEPFLKGLPAGWAVHRLRRVAALIEDANSDAGAPLLSLTIGGELLPRAADVQPPSAEYLLKYGLVNAGDLVVNPMWLTGGSIGVSAASGAVSPEYRIYRFGRDVHPRFIHHLVRSDPFMHQYRLLVRAETTFDRRVTKEDFKELPLVLPPIEVQCAIADYLDAETARIDALIVKKQRMIALLNERRVAMVDTAVMSACGPLRPVAALAQYINGWPFKPDDFTAVGTPVIRIAQLTDPGLEQDLFEGELPDKVTLRDGDLVFSWSGSLQVRRWTRGRAYLNQHLFRVLAADGVDTDWLGHALDTATRLFDEHMHGSAMTHITQSMMKLVKLPLPTLDRQKAIAAELNRACATLDRVIERLLTQLELLGEHRQALTTAAVTGALDIPEVAA